MERLNRLQQTEREKLQARLGVSLVRIAEFCQRYSIQQLAVFGSILRDDFKPESDIDFLVSIAPGFRVTLKYQESLEQELKRMVNRDVDLNF
ncbi:MAG: nucleotidyltransferase family protein [Cyanobacteriota bacterium]|jgi:predicted nucleotidyltransferase